MPRSRSVLVVEDDPDHAWLLTSRLEAGGYEVVGQAETADEAVKVAEATQPDVVLLDLRLRASSGLESIPGMLVVAPRTMIVAVSAVRDREARNVALTAGAFAFVEKSAQLFADDALPRLLTTLGGRFDEVLSGEEAATPIVVLEGQLPLGE